MSTPRAPDAETKRLAENARRIKNWKRWGPYLAERQWGTVREDYSPTATPGTTSRTTTRAAAPTAGARTACSASRDRECRLCFALALWNGRDPILKERLFGLTGPEGNHGEDVKECTTTSTPRRPTPTCKALYKYPQARVSLRAARGGEPRAAAASEPEFELADTGIFDERPLLRRVRRVRQGGARRHAHPHHRRQPRPGSRAAARAAARSGSATPGPGAGRRGLLAAAALSPRRGRVLGASTRRWAATASTREAGGAPELLFTENETNIERLFGSPNRTPLREGRVPRLRGRTADARR